MIEGASTTTNTNTIQKDGIKILHDHDVPMGRGGFVNSHRGHRRYLQMVQDKQLEYVQAKKCNKMQIAWSIVHQLRSLDPPARFVKKDPSTGLWHDVGDKKFREKVSQALREHQPFIKAVIECDDDGPSPRQPVQGHALDTETPGPSLADTCNQDLERLLEAPSALRSPGAIFDEPTMVSKPSILLSSERRRAFLGTRNEGNVKLEQEDQQLQQRYWENECQWGNEERGTGPNLSEFSVSQGPSFQFLPNRSRTTSSSLLDTLFEEVMNAEDASLAGLAKEIDLSVPISIAAEEEDDTLPFPSCFPPCRKTIKRATSHQNETTSPVKKRCMISRYQSEVTHAWTVLTDTTAASPHSSICLPLLQPEGSTQDQPGPDLLSTALEFNEFSMSDV